MKPRALAFAVAASALFLGAGCKGHATAAHSVAVQSPRSEPTTPEATVVAYYGALAQHDSVQAEALLDPALRHEMTVSSGSDLDNVVKLSPLRDLRVAPAALAPGLPGNYRDITQVFVTYDVVYKEEIASGDGANSRFIYVGQDVKTGHWRILEIGTGP